VPLTTEDREKIVDILVSKKSNHFWCVKGRFIVGKIIIKSNMQVPPTTVFDALISTVPVLESTITALSYLRPASAAH